GHGGGGGRGARRGGSAAALAEAGAWHLPPPLVGRLPGRQGRHRLHRADDLPLGPLRAGAGGPRSAAARPPPSPAARRPTAPPAGRRRPRPGALFRLGLRRPQPRRLGRHGGADRLLAADPDGAPGAAADRGPDRAAGVGRTGAGVRRGGGRDRRQVGRRRGDRVRDRRRDRGAAGDHRRHLLREAVRHPPAPGAGQPRPARRRPGRLPADRLADRGVRAAAEPAAGGEPGLPRGRQLAGRGRAAAGDGAPRRGGAGDGALLPGAADVGAAGLGAAGRGGAAGRLARLRAGGARRRPGGRGAAEAAGERWL
ncbi:MAG: Permease of the drug/metabolite transporter (DMT) superfamily, partial [uncultured Thermomicrobiales bacterium]